MGTSPRPSVPTTGLVGVLAATTLLLSTWRFGAAQDRVLYLFLIGLGLAAVPALLAARPRWTAGDLALLAAGTLVLLPITFLATTRARGWALVSVGWLALFLARWLARRHPAGVRLVVGFLVLLGALETGYGFVQSIGGVDYIGSYFRGQGTIATGTFVHHGSYAGLLNMTLALALGSLLAGAGRRQRRRVAGESAARFWLKTLGCASIGLAVLLSQSRGGVLAMGGVILFFACLVALDRRSGRSRGLLAVWVVPAVFVAVGASLGLDALMARFEMMPQDNRPEYYRAAIQVIAAHPWIGVGPEMFRWFVQPYQTIQVDQQLIHAHNDYLQSAAEWGVPLATVLWGLVFHRIYRTVRVFFEATDGRTRGQAAGCAGAMLALVLHGAVDFNFHIPVNFAVFCAIVGVALHLDHWRPLHAGRSPWTVLLRATATVALVGALWQTSPRLRAEWALRAEGPDGGAQAALRLDPEGAEYHYRAALQLRDEPASFDLPASVAAFENAVRLTPLHWRYRQELARAYELQGRDDDAESEFRAALAIKPTRPWNRWQLGAFLIRRQRLDEALQTLRPALADAPELLVPAYFALREAGVPVEQVIALWPPETPARLRLMRLLCGEPRDARVEALLDEEWRGLLAAPAAPAFEQVLFYFRRLLDGGSTAAARQAWIDLGRRLGIEDRDFESGRNRIWNGDFELPASGVFDWPSTDAAGVSVFRAPDEGRGKGAALSARFKREKNEDFASRPVFAVVETGRHVLRFATRSQGLRGGSGVFLQVRSSPQGIVLLESDPIVGDTPWREHEEVFDVPGTGAVQIRLRVRRDGGIDRGLQGHFWLDDLRLEPEGPR